jgi:hypothetical protein
MIYSENGHFQFYHLKFSTSSFPRVVALNKLPKRSVPKSVECICSVRVFSVTLNIITINLKDLKGESVSKILGFSGGLV